MRASLRRRLRRAALAVVKSLGGFALSRVLTRRGLRIVCYHGFSLADEHEWNPGLFIRPTDFDRRLRFLARSPYHVLGLDDALARLERDELPPNPVVITIDDGFFSTYAEALPRLQRYRLPAVLYISTYYVEKGSPLFNLAVPYLFWKTHRSAFDLTPLGIPGIGHVAWTTLDAGARQAVVDAVVRHGQRMGHQADRDAMLDALGRALGADVRALGASRALSFVTPAEARALQDGGVDLELHTHRHRSPAAARAAVIELRDNDRVLRALGRQARHFCYPSGERDRWRSDWLADAGVVSAVTTESGLNFAGADRYALRRFLDSASLSQIEFEAELSGFCDGLRWLKTTLGPRGRRLTRAGAATMTRRHAPVR